MKKIFNFWPEIQFYLKVAICCVIIQYFFSWLLGNLTLNFMSQVLLYWAIGSLSFYSIGLVIEKGIKQKEDLTERLTIRKIKVKEQPFPPFTIKGIVLGESKTLIAVLTILCIAPEVHREGDIFLNFGWFLMRIIVADFCFYVAHWLFHNRKTLIKFHLKHHEFSDTSSFVAGHKSLVEYIVVTITDLLPLFIFGYDITQLLAWTLIGNAYNLEGHSSLSIFFISSDFHDVHHTRFKGNYGIGGFWDRIFNTLTPTQTTALKP
ncbi:MAG: sterol desaturase family protein [Cyanothece sp. SIO2G6]|nr:sterol desaturase family protein [Cyanothece sp. SIO2G6]